MNKIWDVYLITNKVNNKKYVGITSYGYKKRFLKHINESKHKSNRILCKAINKYGIDNFKIELLEQVETEKQACIKEKYFIDKLNTFAYNRNSNGYNQTLGGEGVNGYIVTDVNKEKLRILRKKEGYWKGENNPNYGNGELMRGELHFNYGKHISEETKIKISEANKGKFKGNNNPSSKEYTSYSKDIQTGEILKFNTFYEMKEYFDIVLNLKFNRSSVIGIMRGDVGRKTYKGFVFYREDVTDKNVFKEIEKEYNNSIFNPIYIKEKKGINHNRAKNIECYAYNIAENFIYKFNSWYILKTKIEQKYKINLIYSNMIRVARGDQGNNKGFIFYREDVTPIKVFQEVKEKYIHQK